MGRRINEAVKADVGLVGQSLANTNATGAYHSMRDWDRLMAHCVAGAIAATKTVKLELFEASDAAGTGSKLITGKTATATANALVTKATLTLATVLNAQTVTINGIVFTGHTDTTTAADREFAINGTDTADAAALAGLINDPTYGVPGVLATPSSAVITLTSTEPGDTAITAVASDSTITVATTEAQLFVECASEDLDTNNGFTHVAAKVTTTGTTICAVTMLRGEGRRSPAQQVGASLG